MTKTAKILALSTLMFANNALAYDCFESSPTFQSMDPDAYFEPLSPMKVSKAKQKALNKFIDRLYGEWDLSYSAVLCSGSPKNTKRTSREASGAITLHKNSDTELSVKLDLLFKAQKIFKKELYDLVSLTHASALEVSANQLSISTRRWINRNFLEQNVEIQRSGKKYLIQLTQFRQGHFIASRSISFKIK